MEILKVSAKSKANAVAGALTAALEKAQKAEIQTIGAGAVNQAIKAVAIARGFMAPHGENLTCIPAFMEVEIDGSKRTGIKLIVTR